MPAFNCKLTTHNIHCLQEFVCLYLHFETMNIVKNIPFLIVGVFAWIVIISSCANQGMPTGGPIDSLPPVLINTSPEYKALNFDGDEVHLTFNEYIVTDAIRDKLVISPPLKERPIIRTKSKTLIIEFEEDLKDSTTYSLDFKNSIADNNEKNEYENLRFSFSTGDVYDSLRVAGKVTDAFNLEPEKNVLVMLHKNLHDSAVYTLIPDYIARTDDEGIFLMDNIGPGTYHIFSITDNNNDLMYNEGAEEIAFADTIVMPQAEYVEHPDTLVKGADSLLVAGHTQFYPDPFYLRQFTEDIFDQYLSSYKRHSRAQGTFVFNETVKDTFDVRLLNDEMAVEWYMLEYNRNIDSLTFWITDTVVAKYDTLLTELSYYQLDSVERLYVKKDTVELIFTDDEKETKAEKRKREKKDEDIPEPVEQFSFETNTGTGPFDINKNIQLIAPSPLMFIDTSQILLYLVDDTLQSPLNFTFEKDTAKWRTYNISYNWESQTNYALQIDSAAAVNIYGITNRKMLKKFETRDEDYYGTINLNITGAEVPVVVQLLANNEEETVIQEKTLDGDGTVIFDFLGPQKYKVKTILDRNGNGKWDPGSYQDKYLPESVRYINEVIKVRSNWDSNYNWELEADKPFVKNIRDKELEEQRRKEAEEKAREERQNPGSQQNNMMRNQGLGGPDLRSR